MMMKRSLVDIIYGEGVQKHCGKENRAASHFIIVKKHFYDVPL